MVNFRKDVHEGHFSFQASGMASDFIWILVRACSNTLKLLEARNTYTTYHYSIECLLLAKGSLEWSVLVGRITSMDRNMPKVWTRGNTYTFRQDSSR